MVRMRANDRRVMYRGRYRRVYRRMTGMGWVRRRGRKVNGRERKYRAERKG